MNNVILYKNNSSNCYEPIQNFDYFIDSNQSFEAFKIPEKYIKSVKISQENFVELGFKCSTKSLSEIYESCCKNYSHLLFSRYLHNNFCLYRLGFPMLFNKNDYLKMYSVGFQNYKMVDSKLCYRFLFF